MLQEAWARDPALTWGPKGKVMGRSWGVRVGLLPARCGNEELPGRFLT